MPNASSLNGNSFLKEREKKKTTNKKQTKIWI